MYHGKQGVVCCMGHGVEGNMMSNDGERENNQMNEEGAARYTTHMIRRPPNPWNQIPYDDSRSTQHCPLTSPSCDGAVARPANRPAPPTDLESP